MIIWYFFIKEIKRFSVILILRLLFFDRNVVEIQILFLLDWIKPLQVQALWGVSCHLLNQIIQVEPRVEKTGPDDSPILD